MTGRLPVRHAGARRSWAEIATRLRVSRQSAWERWRDVDDESAPAPTATLIELCADHGITTDEVTVPDVTSMSWLVAQHRLKEERLVAVAAERDQVILGPEAADFVDSPPYARRGAVDETTGLSVP